MNWFISGLEHIKKPLQFFLSFILVTSFCYWWHLFLLLVASFCYWWHLFVIHGIFMLLLVASWQVVARPIYILSSEHKSSCCVILAHLTNDKSNQNRRRQVISFGLEPHIQRSLTNDKLWFGQPAAHSSSFETTYTICFLHCQCHWICGGGFLNNCIVHPCPFVQPVPTYSLFV